MIINIRALNSLLCNIELTTCRFKRLLFTPKQWLLTVLQKYTIYRCVGGPPVMSTGAHVAGVESSSKGLLDLLLIPGEE